MKHEIEIHTCQCGFTWQHGLSGSHDCEPYYRKQIDELNKQVVNLAVENATIKTMNDCLAEELRGYESDGAFDGPDMHKLWHSHAGALPATDIQFANIRAIEAKEIYESILDNPAVTDMESLVDWLESYANNSTSFADQLRKGAAV